MKVGSDPLDEIVEHALCILRDAVLLRFLGEGGLDFFKFVGFVQIGDFSGAEDVVDVFEECIVHGLSVVEEEDCWLVLYPSHEVESLQIYQLRKDRVLTDFADNSCITKISSPQMFRTDFIEEL